MALDLFGEEIVCQPCEPEYGFEEAWQAYPAGPRKVAKKQCLAKWVKLGLSQKASHIIAHIHHMKTEDSWLRGFTPMVLTYLNQERWSEWTPPAPVKRQPDALEAIKAHRGSPMPQEVRQRLQELRRSVIEKQGEQR